MVKIRHKKRSPNKTRWQFLGNRSRTIRPCTEIFYDRGEKYDKEHKGISLLQNEEENDRYIEIWNNVLSQFNATEGLKREDYPELPSKNIDTGMGVERMACILQETETNYETDLFIPIMKGIEEISHLPLHRTNRIQSNSRSHKNPNICSSRWSSI